MKVYRGVDCALAHMFIEAERRAQIKAGYTLVRDAGRDDQLVYAARAYLHGARLLWPWAEQYWKPRTRLENLVRAGALFMAAAELADFELDQSRHATILESVDHVAWLLQLELQVAVDWLTPLIDQASPLLSLASDVEKKQ